jgi:segregation and condensation protein A
MRAVDELDMDTASEFLTMAATLVYIKSRALLPRPAPLDEGEEEDPEVVLIRQLREYKALKEASEKLLNIKNAAGGMFTKLPEEFVIPPREITLLDSTVESLYASFLEALSRERSRTNLTPVQDVVQDKYTVRSQLRIIRGILQDKQSVTFTELFSQDAPREEIIITFLALLDMLMRSEIKLKQSREFGAITISAAQLIENDDDIAYMDE